MDVQVSGTTESKKKTHECIFNEEHPYKNPDCTNGVLWGACDCCDQYFCHVPDGMVHDEKCESIYSPEEIKEKGMVIWKH